MSKVGDFIGTSENTFEVGDGSGGQRSIGWFNGFLGRLLWTPSANRDLVLPDRAGTLALLSDVQNTYNYYNPVSSNNSLADVALFDVAATRFPVGSTWMLTTWFETLSTVATNANFKLIMGGTTYQCGNQAVAAAANNRRNIIQCTFFFPAVDRVLGSILLRIGTGNSTANINTGNTWDYTGSFDTQLTVPNQWDNADRPIQVFWNFTAALATNTTFAKGGTLVRLA